MLWDATCLNSPSFVFLSETKLNQRRAKRLRIQLGFLGCFTMDCRGFSGGLILIWVQLVSVTIRPFSRGHITIHDLLSGATHRNYYTY